jgi:hypothetical protein
VSLARKWRGGSPIRPVMAGNVQERALARGWKGEIQTNRPKTAACDRHRIRKELLMFQPLGEGWCFLPVNITGAGELSCSRVEIPGL